MRRNSRHTGLIVLVLSIAVLSSCAKTPNPPKADSEPANPPPVASAPGSVLKERAGRAAVSMMIGAMIGAPAGLAGSGVGAVVLGTYSLLTGYVPLGAGEPGIQRRGKEPSDAILEREIEAVPTDEPENPSLADW